MNRRGFILGALAAPALVKPAGLITNLLRRPRWPDYEFLVPDVYGAQIARVNLGPDGVLNITMKVMP